jgi:beta-aspartyl-dipeptidase (metallo-type)
MITLIKNVKIYRDSEWKTSEILVADSVIEKIDDKISCDYSDLVIFDGEGRYAIPGLIDSHVHITGGGGEGSFITQVPPIKLSAPVKAGVTTLVGLLGTDGTTRSVANLVAKTKALNEFGMTAFCLTGNYNYPSPTLTGDVMNDIVFINEVIGVKLAITDHRSPNISKEGLIKLASDVRVAGMLGGKAGIVHMHTGKGKIKYSLLFDVLEETDIPISVFRPSHVNFCYDDAIKFANMGGYIDFTCFPNDMEENCRMIIKGIDEAPEGLVTMSTDSNGSLPIWNDKKEMIGIGAAKISALPDTIAMMVKKCGCPLEKAIKPATENAAKSLGLYPKKGVLATGSDADIVLLDEELSPDTVFAKGKCMVDKKKVQVQVNFEDM